MVIKPNARGVKLSFWGKTGDKVSIWLCKQVPSFKSWVLRFKSGKCSHLSLAHRALSEKRSFCAASINKVKTVLRTINLALARSQSCLSSNSKVHRTMLMKSLRDQSWGNDCRTNSCKGKLSPWVQAPLQQICSVQPPLRTRTKP